MGAEKFDHAEQARTLLSRAADDLDTAALQGERMTKVEQAELALKAGHVHAMLAVAEQQRIANLIALVKTQGDGEARDALWEDVGEGFGATYRLRASIGEALGL